MWGRKAWDCQYFKFSCLLTGKACFFPHQLLEQCLCSLLLIQIPGFLLKIGSQIRKFDASGCWAGSVVVLRVRIAEEAPYQGLTSYREGKIISKLRFSKCGPWPSSICVAQILLGSPQTYCWEKYQ